LAYLLLWKLFVVGELVAGMGSVVLAGEVVINQPCYASMLELARAIIGL